MTPRFPIDLPEFVPEKQIGSGGFGTVWLAQQPNLDRKVAIKVGHMPLNDSSIKRRFERECVALGRLSGHSGVVNVYSSGISGEGYPYLVMEYIEGGSLRDRLGDLDEAEVRNIGVQLCSALSAAHELRILHRDLKPANVFLRSNGDAVLGDFGIARLGDGNNTTANQVVATVAYAAPETLDGDEPSPSADIYGVGVTLASVLVGRSPFTSSPDDSISSIIQRVISGRHVDLTTNGVSPGFSSILKQVMSTDPSQRPSSAAELRQVLTSEVTTNAASPLMNSPETETHVATPDPSLAGTSLHNAAVAPDQAVAPTSAPFPQPGEASKPPLPARPTNSPHTARPIRVAAHRNDSRPRRAIGALVAVVAMFVIGAGLFLVINNDGPSASTESTETASTTPDPASPNTAESATTETPTTEPITTTSISTTEDDQTTSTETTEITNDPENNREDATDVTSDIEIRINQRLRFAPGASSSEVGGAVVLGERDVYLLEAEAGQTMLVELTSVSDNASFTLIAPDNTIISIEATNERVTLPLDGDYSLVVVPSPGNATYTMNVTII